MIKEMSREIKFGKGKAVVTVTLQNKSIESDWSNIESSDIEKKVKIEIVSNGKIITTQSHVTLIENNEVYGKYMDQQGMDLNKKYSRVGKIVTEGKEACENIRKAIKEMEEELALEFDVKTESQKMEEKEIAIAKKTIVTAEKEGIENLLSSNDLETWREQYNNINNEGGEGYIPKRVSKEAYSKAVKVLQR